MARKTWIAPLVLFCVLTTLLVQQRHLIHTVLFPLTTNNLQQFNSNASRNPFFSNATSVVLTSATSTDNKSSLSHASNITSASKLGPRKKSNVLKRIRGSLSKSLTRRPRPVSKTRLKSEFERFGSILSSVETGNLTYSSSCVLVAAANTGYRYSKAWVSNRRAEGIPFVLFEVKNVRMGELAAHYARIPALLATVRTLPRARYLVYTDVDTLVDFDIACTRVRKHLGKALSITYKMEHRRRVIRTNWFVIHAWHRRAQHLLLTWLYNGRQVHLQDQTVLNELYARKQWIRDNILPVPLNDDFGRAEIRHCGSYLRARDKCIRSLKMHIYRPNKKFLLGAM